MADNEDWVMRPVVEKMVSYESLIECRVDLADLARMNEALEVRSENEYRLQEAMKE
jgi:hypothetical protein